MVLPSTDSDVVKVLCNVRLHAYIPIRIILFARCKEKLLFKFEVAHLKFYVVKNPWNTHTSSKIEHVNSPMSLLPMFLPMFLLSVDRCKDWQGMLISTGIVTYAYAYAYVLYMVRGYIL